VTSPTVKLLPNDCSLGPASIRSRFTGLYLGDAGISPVYGDTIRTRR
jgi:hypothetical protein